MPLYEFDPTNYEPNFIQPYTAASFNRQDIRKRWDTLGVPYVLKGDHVTSLPGEEWRLAKMQLGEEGLEVELPWLHVSNMGRVISHTTPPGYYGRKSKADLPKWSYEFNVLMNGKLKPYSEKNNRKQLDPNDPRSGWKLFIKVNHFGVLPDVLLDEKTGEMTTAAARGHVDVPIHKLVINTFDPVYEATPDVNPLYLKHVWDKITDKTGRILASGGFEIDHVNQDSLDNRLYQSDGTRQLQYTTGKRNNHNALRARGGSHCNTKQAAQTVDIIKTEFVNPLEELLNDC